MSARISNGKSLRPMLIAAATATLLLVLAVPMAALAQSPHFVKGPTDPPDKTGINTNTVTLSTSFKAAGLGSDPVNVFLTASNVELVTECINHGNHSPPGQSDTGEVTGPTQTIDPHNGQITATATISVTVTKAQAGCPDGMRPIITSATFEDLELHVQDEDGNDLLVYDFGDVDP
ncbi:MAG TPA: hypothetical protein VGQ03_08525 [Nitrososphaera sp.]|jgi:hypothetical protein|nr:hypothetical protein [Nitrososphaera sp.]